MKWPVFFYKAGPNDFVTRFVNGKSRARGKGLSFLVWPWTTVVRIPATDQPFPFAFSELSSDGQDVMIQGEIQVRLDSERILERRDFTIDARTNTHTSDDPHKVSEDVVNVLQTFVRTIVSAKDLKDNLVSVAEIEEGSFVAIGESSGSFTDLGVEVVSLHITSVTPGNRDLKRALEAEAREKMLAAADKAIHDRRMEAAESDRSLKGYEAETALELERANVELIEVQNANLVAEAKAEREATAEKLAPYRDIESTTLLALGIRELASGNVGEVNITSDLLAAIGKAANGS